MRKIYSLVLIAAALLVSTNMWADVNVAHVENFTKQTSGDYTTLKAAFDAIGAGDSAKITLLASTEVGEVILMDGGNDNQAAGKIINLDLGNQNFSITGTNSNRCIFVLAKGKLDITGNGLITFQTQAEPDVNYYTTHTAFDKNSNVKPWMERNQGVCVAVMGSVDPAQTNWSRLIIGENVTLTAAYAAVQLQAINNKVSDLYGYWEIKNTTQNYYNYYYSAWKDVSDLNVDQNVTLSDIWTLCNDGETIIKNANNKYCKQRPSNATLGFGYGINIDIYGHLVGKLYGLQIKGTITANPDLPRNNANAKFPRINVRPGSSIAADSENNNDFPREDNTKTAINTERKQPTAIYASGYAIWDIQGTVTGANGVYVKMGEIVVQGDANISSNATDATAAHHTSSGVSGVGNAITLHSDWSDGTMGITIKADDNGGTPEISSSANGGAAIVETATIPEDPNSQVQNITIEAGDFSGDVNGCVVISDNFDGDISVSGGTYTGSIGTLIGAMDEGEAETIIQTVVSQEGETATVVIGTINTAAGDEVVVVPENEDVAFEGVDEHSVVKLKANSSNISKTLSNDVTMKYLSLTGTGSYTTTVTIPDGKTMTVDQIVMDANGRIIVQAGGKLVVTGTNGIFADDVNNLVLEAVEGNQSIFLFNPLVTTNRHPKATVNLVSKAYRKSDGTQVWQRFGVPAYDHITRADINYPNASAIMYWDNAISGWKNVTPGMEMKPFVGFEVTTQQPTSGDIYSMACNLVGNNNVTIPFLAGWNYFANSYTAEMDVEDLLTDLLTTNAARIQGGIYVYDAENNWWHDISLIDCQEHAPRQSKLDPMQAFLANLTPGEAIDASVNYESVVWNHKDEAKVVLTPSSAPARMSGNMTKVIINVTSLESGREDRVTLRESADFTAELDNGYELEKLINGASFNVYAPSEIGNMVQLATNEIDGQFITIDSKEETSFKMSFSDVNGRDLAIKDMLTGTIMNITEGAEYFFSTGANETWNRFQIVGRQEMPTAVETIENTAASKAVYTVMGQYVGETTDWNNLPAGVYVVDGVKMVK